MANHSRKEVVFNALPGTISQICNTHSLPKMTVVRNIQKLKDECRIHIAYWVRSSRGPWTPFYVVGQGYNKQCVFKPLTDAEKSAARHRRNNAIPASPFAALFFK